MLKNRIVIVAFLSTLRCFLEAAHAQEEYTCIKAGKLFDGKSSSLRENVTILIKGKTIVEAEEKITIPGQAKIMDTPEATKNPLDFPTTI